MGKKFTLKTGFLYYKNQMSYKVNTNRNADYTELLAEASIVSKGWIVNKPSSRDSFYDCVVDLGNHNFVTVQVKKVSSSGSISRVVRRDNQKVTKNGKVRNHIDYADKGVDWLVGVDVDTKEIYYYALETYSKLPEQFSVRKYTPDKFPVNNDVVSNAKSKKNSIEVGQLVLYDNE
jgi:hypothetical protein